MTSTLTSRLRPGVPRLTHVPPLFLLTFVAAWLFFLSLGHRDLIASHEARAAQNAQRMLDESTFGLPTLFDGQVDLQKPPGFYWLVAGVSAIQGGEVTSFTTRLPAAIAGLLTTLVVYLSLRREQGEAIAMLASLALATAIHFTALSRIARIDMPLTAAVSASLFALLRGCEPTTISRYHWWLLAGFAAAVAVLLKGPIGLVLIAATAATFALVERRLRSLLLPALVMGSVIILVTSPWFLWANHQTGGEFFRVFVWHHNVARFLGTAPTLASHPWWYYLPRFAVDFLPWTPAFALLTFWGLRNGLLRNRAFRIGLVWLVVMVLILSGSRFKRADYLLPAYPGAALMLGTAAMAWYRSRTSMLTRRFARSSFAGVVGLTMTAWPVYTHLLEPMLDAREGKRSFAEAIRREAPAPRQVLLFRVESHLLAFHLGRPLHTLVEWGELNDRLAAPGPHEIVTQPIYADEVKAILPHHRLEVIAKLEDFTGDAPPRPLVYLRKTN